MRLFVLFCLLFLPYQNSWSQNFSCDQAKFLLSDIRSGETFEDYFIRKGFNPNFSSQAKAAAEMEGIMRGMFPGWFCSPKIIDVDTGGFEQLSCAFQFSDQPGTEEEILNAAQIFQTNIPDVFNCLGDEIQSTIPKIMTNESQGESLIAVLSIGKTRLTPKQVYQINRSNERLGLKVLDRSLKYTSNATIEYGYLQQEPNKPVVMEVIASYTINPDTDSYVDENVDCSLPEGVLSGIANGDYSKLLKHPNQGRAANAIFAADTCSLNESSRSTMYSCNFYDKNIEQVYETVSSCFGYYEWSDRYNDEGFKSYYTRRNSKNVRLSVRETESSLRGDYVRLTIMK